MYYCWWNIKDQNYESADLKCSMFLDTQSFQYNDRFHECFLLYLNQILKLLPRNVMRYVILGAINALSLSVFDNEFMYWNIILVGETVYSERIISCWSLIVSICSLLLNARVARSDWTSTFIPPRRGAHEWRSLDRIFHPDISWAWVMKTL